MTNPHLEAQMAIAMKKRREKAERQVAEEAEAEKEGGWVAPTLDDRVIQWLTVGTGSVSLRIVAK